MSGRLSGSALHWVVGVLVAFAAAAATAYGLDWAARIGAESLVARSIEHSRPAPRDVDVTVRGAFFLPDVVDGSYPHVQVRARRIEQQHLVVRRIDADLYDVGVPVSSVVRQHVTAITVARTTEHALITYQALNDYLRAQGQPITVAKGKGNRLRLTAHLIGLGRSLAVSADATVQPAPGHIDVTPTTLDTGSSVVDTASQVLLRLRLAFRIPTSPLPFGQQVQRIVATDAGVEVTATGRKVVIFP